jgi:hypothetical protein
MKAEIVSTRYDSYGEVESGELYEFNDVDCAYLYFNLIFPCAVLAEENQGKELKVKVIDNKNFRIIFFDGFEKKFVDYELKIMEK